EVSAFFGELRVREEQYQNENNVYLSTGTSDTSTFPATPGPSPQSINPEPATWTQLKVRMPESTARCGYVVVTGTPYSGTVGAIASTTFHYTRPTTRNWYYVLAHCDLDGSSSKDAYYFTASDDPVVKSVNPCHCSASRFGSRAGITPAFFIFGTMQPCESRASRSWLRVARHR